MDKNWFKSIFDGFSSIFWKMGNSPGTLENAQKQQLNVNKHEIRVEIVEIAGARLETTGPFFWVLT